MSSARHDNLTLAEAKDFLDERDATIRRLKESERALKMAFEDQAQQISGLRQSLARGEIWSGREACSAAAPVCAESALLSGLASTSDPARLAEALEVSMKEQMDERAAATELRSAVAEAIAEAARQKAAAVAARAAADEAVLALRASRDVVGFSGMPSRETAELVGMELSKAKLEVVTLTGQLAAAESQLSSSRVAQHIEARDTLSAASLCRQSVKEIVSLHRALDAIVACMEDDTRADGAAASATAGADVVSGKG
jgi:hypothetical protein